VKLTEANHTSNITICLAVSSEIPEIEIPEVNSSNQSHNLLGFIIHHLPFNIHAFPHLFLKSPFMLQGNYLGF
jgi:hypothetical protein